MSKIEIELELKDEAFATMYARRLAELSPQLSIKIKDGKEMTHKKENSDLPKFADGVSTQFFFSGEKTKAIITDRDDYPNINDRIIAVLSLEDSNRIDTAYHDEQDIRKFYMYSSVREILKYIIAAYEEKTGCFIGTGNDEEMKTFAFYSRWGGCGTTSVAITFAKHLATYKGGRVVFLSSGADCLMYSHCRSKPCKHPMQLEYAIRQRRPFSLEDYVYEDELGINYIISLIPENLMLGEIRKTGKFQYVIVDYGKTGSKPSEQKKLLSCQSIFCVAKDDDMRCEFTVPEEHILINNRSVIARNDHDFYSIPIDNASFTLTDCGIKIDLFGGFGTAIKKIVRVVTDENVLS